MRFRVLGTVEALCAGIPVPPGPPQRQAALCALLADAGHPVPAGTIMDRVWDDPPAADRRALHAHVARLRRARGQGPDPVRIEHHTGAYTLRAHPDQVDLHLFRRLVAAPPRPQLLEEALGLWQGAPLSGIPGAWAARVRHGLTQQWIDAVAALAGSRLDGGAPGAAVGLTRSALVDHPGAEPLAEVLLRALAADGRRTEALDCYAALRAHLREAWGAEPGGRLQHLHRALLRSDEAVPAVRHPAAPNPAAPNPAGRQPPAQLPPGVQGFVGRRAELERLDRGAPGRGVRRRRSGQDRPHDPVGARGP